MSFGQPQKVLPDQKAVASPWCSRDLVLTGPDLIKHELPRWRCSDLREVIAKWFDVKMHERTVRKLLRRPHLTRL